MPPASNSSLGFYVEVSVASELMEQCTTTRSADGLELFLAKLAESLIDSGIDFGAAVLPWRKLIVAGSWCILTYQRHISCLQGYL